MLFAAWLSPELSFRAQRSGAEEPAVPSLTQQGLVEAPAFRPVNSTAKEKGPLGPALPAHIRNELKSVETEIKYSGYLDQQKKAIDKLKKAEERSIPEWFDYKNVSGLSREMQEKLLRVRPQTIGQASRIPGVTPAALSLINIYIEIQAKRGLARSAN